MSHLARFAILLTVPWLAACGGKSSASDDTGGGGTAAGGTGSSSSGTGASGAATDCTEYDDDSPLAINIELLNKTDAPIYLGQERMTCSVDPLFQVADARGDPVPSLGWCRAACELVRTVGATGGCADTCTLPLSVALQPGESRAITWDGWRSVRHHVPAQCVAFNRTDAGLDCEARKRIEPGTYMFSARAGTGIDCSETAASGTCSPCAPDGDGGCVASSVINGELLTARATVLLDERYGVYGSSAGSPSPGGNSSGAAVNLVFTNP